jgi:epoxyqueuosine reductase
MNSLSNQIKSKAKEIGFNAIGITGPEILMQAAEDLDSWLKSGFQGTMDWMEKTAKIRSNPRAFFDKTASVLMVALNYFRNDQSFLVPPNYGNISIYARERDYHKVIRKKLKLLLKWIQVQAPSTEGRIFVDSFPIMEKAFAVKAGLGWIGKNTMLIIKGKGS